MNELAETNPPTAPGDTIADAGPSHRPEACATKASAAPGLPISVVILTQDEELNIVDCLRSCTWCDDVHVLDSGSTDRTREIAGRLGAKVHVHPFTSFGEQRNWAIDQIEHRHDWVFHLDADERFTPELVAEMRRATAADAVDGYLVPSKLMFDGKWLRWSSGYPVYQVRLFHRTRMRFIDHGHGQREMPGVRIERLKQPYLHFNFSKGMSDWLQKHDRYSTLEARRIVTGSATHGQAPTGGPLRLRLRRWIKGSVYPRLPARWLIRFFWSYFLRGGFLDGRRGLHYCLLISGYELMIQLKVAELTRKGS